MLDVGGVPQRVRKMLWNFTICVESGYSVVYMRVIYFIGATDLLTVIQNVNKCRALLGGANIG